MKRKTLTGSTNNNTSSEPSCSKIVSPPTKKNKTSTTTTTKRGYEGYISQLDECINNNCHSVLSSSSNIVPSTTATTTNNKHQSLIHITNSNTIHPSVKKDLLNRDFRQENVFLSLTQSVVFNDILQGRDLICEYCTVGSNKTDSLFEDCSLSYLIPLLTNVYKVATSKRVGMENSCLALILLMDDDSNNSTTTNCWLEKMRSEILMKNLPTSENDSIVKVVDAGEEEELDDSDKIESQCNHPIVISTFKNIIPLLKIQPNLFKHVKCTIFHHVMMSGGVVVDSSSHRSLSIIDQLKEMSKYLPNKNSRQTIFYSNSISSKISSFVLKELTRSNPPFIKLSDIIAEEAIIKQSIEMDKSKQDHSYLNVKFPLKLVYLFSLVSFLVKYRKFQTVYIYFSSAEICEYYEALFEYTKDAKSISKKSSIYFVYDGLIDIPRALDASKAAVIHFEMPPDNSTYLERIGINRRSIVLFTKGLSENADILFQEKKDHMKLYDKFSSEAHCDLTIQFQCEKIVEKYNQIRDLLKDALKAYRSTHSQFLDTNCLQKQQDKLKSLKHKKKLMTREQLLQPFAVTDVNVTQQSWDYYCNILIPQNFDE